MGRREWLRRGGEGGRMGVIDCVEEGGRRRGWGSLRARGVKKKMIGELSGGAGRLSVRLSCIRGLCAHTVTVCLDSSCPASLYSTLSAASSPPIILSIIHN